MRNGLEMTKEFRRQQWPRILPAVKIAASSVTYLLITGCSRAPSFNILGSFFPSWMLCGVIGILLTVAVRLFFVRVDLEQYLVLPLIVVYPCLTALFTFTLWLLFFS
jgi:hypothetical protein